MKNLQELKEELKKTRSVDKLEDQELINQINMFRKVYHEETIDQNHSFYHETKNNYPRGAIEFPLINLDFPYIAPTEDFDEDYILAQDKWEIFKKAADNFYEWVKENDFDIIKYNKRKALENKLKWWRRTYGDDIIWRSEQNKNKKTKDPGYIYLLKGDNSYKIGKSKEPDKRYKHLEVKLPFRVKLIHKVKSNQYSKLESFLHDKFSDKQVNGEWFNLNKEDIRYIKNLDGDEYA